MALTFLVGGARSGKSSLAVKLARTTGAPVVFIATAEALDDEMTARIEHHRTERPAEWDTFEAPIELESALSKVPGDAIAIVDCLTLWVTNLMGAGLSDEAISDRAAEAAEVAVARPAPTIAVSNEVGLGIVPMDAYARRFRDVLGRVNATWANRADRALFVASGRGLPLHDGFELLDGTP
jgi:adenosylcobinamide kinase / adenosylcobinamide-phosphate guanylyltransferase